MYVAVKGGETAIAHSLDLLADKRRGDRDVAELSLAADRPAARARGRSRDDRGLLLRPRACGARHQAGARRPRRGDLPAARLSHDAAAVRRHRCRSTPAAWSPSGASPRPSRTYRAARCWARPTTTPIACSTSRWRPTASGRPRRPRRSMRHATLPRVGDILEREGLLEPPPPASRRRRGPHPQAAHPARRRGRCGCRTWRAATRASCWRSAIRPSAATATTIPSSARSASASVPVVVRARGAGLRHRDRRDRRHRVRHGQPVRGLARRAAAIHPRLWPGLRPCRAQGDGHGAGRPRAARRGARRECALAGAGRGVRAGAQRQRRGLGLRAASQAAALCRLPVRAGDGARAARGGRAAQPARRSTRRRSRADARTAPTTTPTSTSRPSA